MKAVKGLFDGSQEYVYFVFVDWEKAYHGPPGWGVGGRYSDVSRYSDTSSI